MQPEYFLQHGCAASPQTKLRHHSPTRLLKVNDPALRAISDPIQDPPLTVTEELTLEQVVDEMFRWGARALLVVRDDAVVGLITAERAIGGRGMQQLPDKGSGGAHLKLCVADVMTPVAELPAIDWRVLERARICDLLEIFEGSGVPYLAVLEDETPHRSRVRGMIFRDRLQRQLGIHRATRFGVDDKSAT